MGPSQSGRMVQRLFEMETYRLLALLALPEAKRQMRELDRLGTLLRRVTLRMSQQQGHDASMLDELTDLSAQGEQLIAQSQYRFAAARATTSWWGAVSANCAKRACPGCSRSTNSWSGDWSRPWKPAPRQCAARNA